MLAPIQGLALRTVRSFTAPAPGDYSTAQKLVHWGIALLCLGQVPTAWAIQRTHRAHAFMPPSEMDLFFHSVHAWAGWTILGLVGVRLVVRAGNDGPALPTGMRPIQRHAATASHLALYGLLVALPITGTLAMYISQAFAPIHRALTWTLLGLVILHALAALWHQLVLRDGTLKRILPWTSSKRGIARKIVRPGNVSSRSS